MTDIASRHSKGEKFVQILSVLLVPLSLLTIIIATAWYLRPGASRQTGLEIIAHRVSDSPETWTLNGHVRLDGTDVVGARVWVILRGGQGDRHSPPGTVTTTDGQFTLPNLPKKFGDTDVRVTEIHARLTKEKQELNGVEFLPYEARGLGTTGPPIVIGALALVLMLSMLLPFLGAPNRTRYVQSIVLAVFFSFSVIGGVGYGMYKVHSTGSEGRVPALGFICVFKGTYVEELPPQWLISLSDRGQSATTDKPTGGTPVEKGFGAPLWVLLLAAVGSGILTVSLITREIKEPPNSNADKIQEKIYNAVQHQVYVLFSPIGAIFVYQTMVVTKTAGHPLIVAVAALGAGAALNALLKYAVESATALFTKTVPQVKPAPAEGTP